MQKILLVSSFLILTVTTLLSYDIEYRNNGFDIKFDNIDYNMNKDINNQLSVYPSFSNLGSYWKDSPFETGIIIILFAIPDYSNPSFYVKSIDERQINGQLKKNDSSNFAVRELDISYSLDIVGKQRGVQLASLRIYPISYKPEQGIVKLIDAIELRIDYGQHLQDNHENLDIYELQLFNHLINKEHLSVILSEKNKIKKNVLPRQLKNDWYNPKKEYVRLSTTKDGLATVYLSDIIRELPEISNKSYDYLHLIKNGEEVPLHYIDNDNGYIDNGDRIIFLGSRAKGDTTWTDHYADKFNFYILYDEEYNGERYISFPNVSNPSTIINDVILFKHIEIEKTYHRGFPQESSETMPGEGWFWKVLSPTINWDNTISDTLMIIPSKQNESLQITYHFASCYWEPLKEGLTAHSLELDINSNNPKKKNYLPRNRDSISNSFMKQDIIPGMNIVNLKSLKVYDENNVEITKNQIGADFYTYRLNSKPYAKNGKSNFFVTKLTEASELLIPNFSNSKVWVIDTINNYISSLNGSNGFFAVVSTDFKKKQSSLVINNNSSIQTDKNGLFIAYLDSEKYNSRFFESSGNEALDYLKSIPENAFIAVSFNGFEKLEASIVDYFRSIGSIEILNVKGNDQWVFYGIKDIALNENYSTNELAAIDGFIETPSGNSYQVSVNLPKGYESELIFTDESVIEKSEVTRVNQTKLSDFDNQADLLVFTHKSFINSANKYAEFRKKSHDDFSIEVIDVDDVYKEFNYGKKSPHAFKEFLKTAYSNWKSPKVKYVLFWGDASWDVRKIEKGSVNEDFVPSFGWPSSDYWFALLDDDYIPELQIGRVPINTDLQGLDYLDKLILNDTIENKPWMKKFLMITGGQTENEIEGFYIHGKYTYCEFNIAKTDLCADTQVVSKQVPANTTESYGGQIQRIINDGVLWTYYIGHGSARVMDMDGWQVQKLNNKGKYGFMSTLSCNTGAFSEPNLITRNEEYVIEKDKGFIGTGGSSGVSWETMAINFGLLMLQSLSTESPALTYLEAIWYAKSRMIYSIEEKLTSSHFTYLGDPLVYLKISKKPDFYFIRNQIEISTQENSKLISTNDTLIVSGELFNLGHRYFRDIDVILIHKYDGHSDTLKKKFYGLCYPAPFEFSIDVINKPGTHIISIQIDPENITGDINLKNNRISFIREVFNPGIYPLEPLSNWNMNHEYPKFRVLNPQESGNDYRYSFRILTSVDTTVLPLEKSIDEDVFISDDYIEWQSKSILESNRNYWLSLFTVKKSDNTFTPIQILPFNTLESPTNENALLTINNAFNFKYSGTFDDLQINSDNNIDELMLKEEKVNFYISSVYGSSQSPDRDAEIRFNDAVYITVPPDILGFKLVAVSSDSVIPYAVRNYNTYDDYEQAKQFVRFIKDSVANGDYLLLATNGESFRAFRHLKFTEPESIGSLDSLKYYLKNYYGSELTDTMDVDIGSYSMIGRKNYNPDSTIEVLNFDGDTAKIEGYVTRYVKEGLYSSKLIGPAKSWSELLISYDKDSLSSLTCKVFGLSSSNGQKEIIITEELNDTNLVLDLSKVDASLYPQISIELEFKRTNEHYGPSVSNIQIGYIPSPELVISRNQSYLNRDTILRGDELQSVLKIKNISLRSASTKTFTNISIDSESKPISETNITVPEIQIDSEIELSFSEVSDNFDTENFVFCQLNPADNFSELYTFNNDIQLTQYLVEDTIKPSIIFKLDGKIVNEGDYVSKVPYIEIELHDNSPLIVNDVSKIGVGINRPFPGLYDTVFTSYGRETPLKASLAFLSDTLDFGENYFRIIVYDAAGNSDTLTRKVNVSLNGSIEDIFVYPNPFVDEVNIEFTLKAPGNEGNLNMTVYNLSGQKIYDYSMPALVGSNLFKWDGRDYSGAVQPSGVYAFVIKLLSSIYSEPKTGKVLIVR